MNFNNDFTEKYQTERRAKDGSQHGEEGIINEILKRLEIDSGWLLDVGAWNGKCFSNTFQLVKTGRYKAVEIEAVDNNHKFQALLKTAIEYPNIVPLNRWVSHKEDSPDLLDNILKETPIPNDFELMNLDIDGYDYHVWDSLMNYLPKVVIIEFNYRYKRSDYIYDPDNKPEDGDGSSFMSILKLASKKGYSFVCTCGCNMFFVRNDLYSNLNLENGKSSNV